MISRSINIRLDPSKNARDSGLSISVGDILDLVENVDINTVYVSVIPTTGATITLAVDDKRLLIKPADTIATLNVILPPTPVDGGILQLSSTQTITELTVTAPDDAIVRGGIQTLVANGGMAWGYDISDTSWNRIY